MFSSYPWPVTFLLSFLVYSACRFFDERSTRKVAGRLNIFRHEINDALLLLARRFGLEGAFKIMWVAIAIGIASLDTLLNTPATYVIPAAAVFFGFVHLLAAAHNYELYYNIKDKTQAEIEESDLRTARTLSQLDWWGRLKLIAGRNAFSFFLAAFSLVILSWPLSTILLLTVAKSQSVWYALNYSILISILGLLLFFPAITVGMFLVSSRLVKSYERGELIQTPSMRPDGQIAIPIETLKDAIRSAETTGESTVQLRLCDLSLDESTLSSN